MENYTLKVDRNGLLRLYHHTTENTVAVDNLIATFQDWHEFMSIVTGQSFTRNPFEGVGNLYIHGPAQ